MSPLKIYSGVAIIAALTAWGAWSARNRFRLPDPYAPEHQPIPVKSAITADLAGTDAAGQPASFAAVKGKVCACSYLFTRCPHGCAIVFGAMRELRDRFGSHPDFHLASLAVLPDMDSPGVLREFAVSQGVNTSDPWLLLTGFTRASVWQFTETQLGMTPTRETPSGERLSSCDYCEHDLRIVLIDRQSRIRGHYAVMQTNEKDRAFMLEKLINDTRRLLEDKDSSTAAP